MDRFGNCFAHVRNKISCLLYYFVLRSISSMALVALRFTTPIWYYWKQCDFAKSKYFRCMHTYADEFAGQFKPFYESLNFEYYFCLLKRMALDGRCDVLDKILQYDSVYVSFFEQSTTKNQQHMYYIIILSFLFGLFLSLSVHLGINRLMKFFLWLCI